MARLTAFGFLAGASIHAVAFILLAFGVEAYGHSYPPLRHVLMASIDATVGSIGVRRPQWLLSVLTLFVIQRIIFNGGDGTAILATVAWLAILMERQLSVTKV